MFDLRIQILLLSCFAHSRAEHNRQAPEWFFPAPTWGRLSVSTVGGEVKVEAANASLLCLQPKMYLIKLTPERRRVYPSTYTQLKRYARTETKETRERKPRISRETETRHPGVRVALPNDDAQQ
ncbi:hypothetical protein NDU88_005807 [Pleurodeles waltl]|uniref:Secreted protein n=1 Tax=Pleurodeles waltl TaxID=8319 RepID=A0AAV7MAE8_PLEWA|nr:hypothetical protein NDU88_005807 [Pleurodeles waltl]